MLSWSKSPAGRAHVPVLFWSLFALGGKGPKTSNGGRRGVERAMGGGRIPRCRRRSLIVFAGRRASGTPGLGPPGREDPGHPTGRGPSRIQRWSGLATVGSSGPHAKFAALLATARGVSGIRPRGRERTWTSSAPSSGYTSFGSRSLRRYRDESSRRACATSFLRWLRSPSFRCWLAEASASVKGLHDRRIRRP